MTIPPQCTNRSANASLAAQRCGPVTDHGGHQPAPMSRLARAERWIFPGTSGRAATFRAAIATLLFAPLALVVAACGGDGGSSINSDLSSQSLTLRVGSTATLTDPSYSPGIGDDWTVVVEPDPDVATITSVLRDCGQPGCTGELDEVITAVGQGTTTITLKYCYRSAPPDGEPAPGESVRAPVVIDLTVQ